MVESFDAKYVVSVAVLIFLCGSLEVLKTDQLMPAELAVIDRVLARGIDNGRVEVSKGPVGKGTSREESGSWLQTV